MGNLPCCQKNEQSDPPLSNRIKSTRTVNRVQQKLTSSMQKPQHISKKQQPSIQPLSRHGPENYQSLKYLGRGTFGDVVLAQDKQTSKQYAMKIIDKSKIKQVNLMQCKTIKQISNRDILVTIRQTFQNQNKIYIIMEYMPKGDIYFYLRKREVKFNEDVIRNLVAEIVYGVEVLHNYGIIYRELKPENILVTNEGHIKLTDYGLSKMLIEDKTSTCTFIGALEYMAPEAIKGNYGKEVDIWSIGVLIFQLIFQRNPFSTIQHTQLAIQHNIENTYIQDILNQNIGKISQQLRDLLIGLLQKNPQKRLTIEDIKSHSFFRNIDWEDIRFRRNTPPLKQYVQKNDHIRFRDPTNDSENSHRFIKYTCGKDEKQQQQYTANLYQFRNSK